MAGVKIAGVKIAGGGRPLAGRHPGAISLGMNDQPTKTPAPSPFKAHVVREQATRPSDPEPAAETETAGRERQAKPRPGEPATWAKEVGGPQGPEPTRYGDWERKGICSDF